MHLLQIPNPVRDDECSRIPLNRLVSLPNHRGCISYRPLRHAERTCKQVNSASVKDRMHLLQIPNPVRDDECSRVTLNRLVSLSNHRGCISYRPLRHAELDSASVKEKMHLHRFRVVARNDGCPLLLIPLRKVLGVGGFHLADGFYKARNHSKV